MRNAAMILVLTLGTAGCLVLDKSSDRLALHLSISGEGFGAIRTLGSAQEGNCVSCHSDGGKSPRWMASDESRSASSISYAIDTSNPGDSYLVSKALDGHYLPTGRKLDKADWVAAIQAYVSAASSSGDGGGGLPGDDDGSAGSRGRLFTLPQSVPAPVPTYVPAAPQNPANFRVMTFPLNIVNPALAGVSLTFEIVMDNLVPNTYRLYQPKIVNTTSQSIYIEGIKVIFNDAYLPGQQSNWNGVVKFIPPGTTAQPSNPIVSPATILLTSLTPTGSASDQIQISFERAEVTTAVSCRALTQFVTTVRPIIATAINCFRCHQGTNANATAAFNMNGSDDTLCANFLGRSDLTTPSASAIIVYPGNARNGHPNLNPTYNSAQVNTITSWLEAEAAARGL